MINLIFINSHPTQYFAPLYQAMAKDKDISLQVFYLSEETVNGYMDSQFGVDVKWDIPLLGGYNYTFIRNNSWKPSFKNGFFGLINLGLIEALRRVKPKSVIVVHGWAYFSNLMAIYVSKMFGYTVCLRGESPLKQECGSGFKRIWKSLFFKLLLFPFVDKVLFIGEQNRLFYKKWGIADKDLIFTPYSVDNDRFRKEFLQFRPNKDFLRSQFNIPVEALVLLYSGKYIPKKRPLDLLQAFLPFKTENIFLVMVGEGELRPRMEEFIEQNDLTNHVLLTGFVNQGEISKYYAISDVFVMCSGAGETWGLSVNEAMNFYMPLIISDLTGCSDDLVLDGENGYTFKTSNIAELKKCIARVAVAGKRSTMGEISYKIVSEYSFETIINNIKVSMQ